MGFTLRRSPSEDRRLRANAAAAAERTGIHRSSRTRHSAVSPRDSSKHSLTSSDDDNDDDESSSTASSSSSWSSSSSSAALPASVPLRAALQSASAMRFPPSTQSAERSDSDDSNLGAEDRVVRRLARRYVEGMADPSPMPRTAAMSQESARDLLARTRAAARRLRETRRRLELASQTARRAVHPAAAGIAGIDSASDSDSSMDIDRVQPQPQYIAAPSASTAPFWSLVVRLDGMLADSVHQTHPASPVAFSRDAHQPDWQTPRGLIADGIVPVTDRVRMLPSPAPAMGPGMELAPVGEDAAGGASRAVNATDVQRHLV
ncbi:hypothetical protein AMAG_15255 [Allomyces macrogynus ATCC 38327]|uniref:Uncharacterized protein n=1 Tax=Allomyces macrogynus (strain ATCC 38327) TaxID=578462 RepID=A0A0L0T8D2_ALLM3|nr:hypothetical protein AMAG_15255 [Allomyces macrogynus ATCC 38327]|eukprot:KNE70997.1 hypothetical protein AMAG_15255 [Allomyces macrogynus ATCC 38327]